MKRALVAGGGGFVGYHLASHLADNNLHVTVLDNMSRGTKDRMFSDLINRENVVFTQSDMTEKYFYSSLSGKYDYIYHLVALNGTKNFYNRPYEVLRINILSLMNLLEWCSPDNCGAFLFTSSSEGYAGTVNTYLAEHPEYIPTKEDIPLCIDDVFNPRYSYGGSKILGELLTKNYCDTKNIPFKIVRYHNIYGPRMGFDHVFPELIKRIHARKNPFPIYGGVETRAFCDVTDGVKATEAVMLSPACNSEIIHIGNSLEEIAIQDVLDMLLDIAGFAPEIEVMPAPEGSVKRRCPDTTKLVTLTGYRASTSLSQGLKVIFDWYMEEYDRLA